MSINAYDTSLRDVAKLVKYFNFWLLVATHVKHNWEWDYLFYVHYCT